MRKSLTKQEILSKKADISHVFLKGKGCRLKGLKIKFIKNNFDFSRLLVTFIKNYGNSVVRNREKRRIKEIYRLLKCNIMPGYDIVIIVFPGMYSFQDRLRQIKDILIMSNLFNTMKPSSKKQE